MNTNDAKEYLARREIPQLFESLLTGLMYHRPDDPVDYLEVCLKKVRELGGPDKVRWDTFVGQEKKPLPPINGGQSRRSLLRNVMPDSPNFPYRRYERLPPISQFSIESDSDLSETAELIEEYEVFDPSRPRPKVILVIGGPGSGKGTQCLKIAERYGFQYVSVGELLRKKMIHNATSNRKWSLIAKIITNGELAPQETTITEIKQKIMKIPDANGIVIDGFPRDVGQALSFEDQICTPDVVVFLACTNHHLKERLQRRAEQQGRPDDNPKAIDRRLTNFKQNTIPLVKYFQERGLIVTLDAARDEEEVFCDISATLDNKLFPSQESTAGPSEPDLSTLPECNMVDFIEKNDEDEEEEELGYAEESQEFFCAPPKKPKVIFLMGAAGSGKRTQCERMEDKLGLRHVTLADLLCGEMQTPGDRGRHLRDVLQRGEPLPEDVTMDLLCEALTSRRQAKGVVVCGFPVDLRQAQLYEAKMGEPTAVLLLSCSTQTLAGRLQSRRSSASSVGSAPDKDGTPCWRADSFWADAKPVAEHYDGKKILHTIDAERSPDQVFAQICKVMESSLAN
ncbi:adenylate kinase isoenzyme 5 [Corythoichthys intestinalis]|uniref:adenylate kinase isoenzyme 5 n=1 Tax=Corythoichthys intestinalis TaxID=161448 RepID=UPI0025A689A6|nr:adenylate kinase isoenzyme 5 [Corythoichthys intestinalis]XP_061795545.1 adenylate kinase isoenzyme 5-like [Nerophis lumbriciformis]